MAKYLNEDGVTYLWQKICDTFSGQAHTHDASYLKLSGGTLTGNLKITTGSLVIDHKYSADGNTIIYKNNRINPSEGGWADEIITVKDSTDNSVFGFGVYGGSNELKYSYLGTNSYNGDNFRIYSDRLAFGNNVIYHAGNLNKSVIEKVLTGNITSHTHSQYLTSLPSRLSQYITAELDDGNGFGKLSSGSPFKTFVNSSYNDCMLITTAYSNTWRGELALDYYSNNIAYRNNKNGTWNSWAMMLTTDNFNKYALPLSGGTLTGDLDVSNHLVTAGTLKVLI